MRPAAPSEAVDHGGTSKGFPSMSTRAKRSFSEEQKTFNNRAIHTSSLFPFFDLVQKVRRAVSLQTG